MRTVRALLFDFNGTLSDDEPLLSAIYQELFAEHGRPLTHEQYVAELSGHSEEEIIGGWLGIEGATLEALVAERIDRYRRAASDGTTVSAAAREAVHYAAGRVPVAVVSGAFRAEIEPVVAAAGIAGLFTTLVTADDVTDGKPHPEGYLLALERLRVAGEGANVVAFEDTEAGIASAKAAGIRCVAVGSTQPPHRLAAADERAASIDLELVRRFVG